MSSGKMMLDGVPVEEINNEIIPLLASDRAEVRAQTLEFFLGLTASEEHLSFFSKHEKFLEAIIARTEDTEKEISRMAYKTLVNLTSSEKTSDSILMLKNASEFVYNLVNYVLKDESLFADLVCSVLCNITRHEDLAKKVVGVITSNSDIGFDKIVLVLCTKNFNKHASLDLLALFLSNLSQISETRKYILDKERCVVQRLLPFSHDPDSAVRKRGVVATLKNCCFETAYHEWLLGPSVDILPSLLLPLAGPEEFEEADMEKLPVDLQYLDSDKTREPQPEIRKMLVEALFRLCATKFGRQYFKEKNVYIIIREMHKVETNKQVELAIENLVTVLIGDEPEEQYENLQEVNVPEDVQEQFEKGTEELTKSENIPEVDDEVLLME